jgi:hypothetical protein
MTTETQKIVTERISSRRMSKKLSRTLAVSLTLGLALSQAPAFAASFDWDSSIVWADLEIYPYSSGYIEDLDIIISGSAVSTDVFDDGGRFRTSQTSTYDQSSNVSFTCETPGEQTVDGTTSLLLECDGGSSRYSGLDYEVDLGIYFWDRGEKFRYVWTLTNKTSTDITISAQISNDYGSSSDNSHYAFGNSSEVSAIPFGDEGDDTYQILTADARWTTHYEEDDAPIGFAWGSDSSAVTPETSHYAGDEIEVDLNGITVPANDFVQIAAFYSWPVQTLIDANYTNDPTQPLSHANEAYMSISSMQANPTDAMFNLVDPSRIVNWEFVVESAPVPYAGPVIMSYSDRSPVLGQDVVIDGKRLGSISSISIDGIEASFSHNDTTGALTLTVPARLQPGLKNLVILSSNGRLTAQDAFTVTSAPAVADTKVNAGSFKGYVALYAKGHKGSKMSAIVAGKWIVVASLATDFERVVRYTGAGYDIVTSIYIDGEMIDTFNVTTK